MKTHRDTKRYRKIAEIRKKNVLKLPIDNFWHKNDVKTLYDLLIPDSPVYNHTA